MNDTLTEKIEISFENVRLSKALVKIPRLRIRKSHNKKRIKQSKPKHEIPTSTIIRILLKAVNERKKDEKKKLADSIQYKVIRDERPLLENAGYGTVSKSYGSLIKAAYIDYGKLFSYLGEIKSRNAFEDFDASPTQLTNRILDQGNKFYFVDREVIDTGVRTLKYFIPGEITGEIHVVPVGVNSTDWEKFKLWMKIDPVMFNLKMKTL